MPDQITREEARDLYKRQANAAKAYGRELSLYNHEASMACLATLLYYAAIKHERIMLYSREIYLAADVFRQRAFEARANLYLAALAMGTRDLKEKPQPMSPSGEGKT